MDPGNEEDCDSQYCITGGDSNIICVSVSEFLGFLHPAWGIMMMVVLEF